MAHNINTYIGRQAAWHKLGTVTAKYMTTDEPVRNLEVNGEGIIYLTPARE